MRYNISVLDQVHFKYSDSIFMTINQKLFDVAKELEPTAGVRVAAAIAKRHKILSIGVNSKSSNALARKFSKNNKALYNHAEIAAIHDFINTYQVEKLRRCDMYICRAKFTKSGWHYGLAKPCDGCWKAIKHFGIKNVYFTREAWCK